jgi:hypothetical protein
MAKRSDVWTPLWSESCSRRYNLRDKFAGREFGQRAALAPEGGEAQGGAEQQQVQAFEISPGPGQAGGGAQTVAADTRR